MKKIFKLIALSIASIAMIAGCVKFDNSDRVGKMTNSNGEYAIVFSNSPATKATVNPVSNQGYDEFSLYAWNSNSEVVMNPFTVQEDGSDAYKYDGVGSQTLQYFKNNANNYSFIGVIPTTTATLSNNSVTVGVESFTVDDKKAEGNGVKVDSPKEFLWAYTNVVKDDYNKNVTLPFKHGNALLYLGFISNDANTKILDYTPHVDYQPAQPAVPGTVTTTTKTGKAIDMLVNGEIVYWPYASNATLTSTQPNPRYDSSSNYGNMGALMDDVNAQFVYYNTSGTEMAVTAQTWDNGSNTNFKNMYGFKLASTVDKAAFAAGNDVFWTNASDQLKTTFQAAYDAGWRVVRIQHYSGSHYCAFLINNTEMEYKVRTETGGSPAVPEVLESGYKGIRVFSAKEDATKGYAHVKHTTTAEATVSTDLSFDNRVTSSNVIQFSLPEDDVKQYTGDVTDVNNRSEIENTFAVYSPTTFYAIPGDTDLTHFVVKLSYTYMGTTVYDVRVPIALPPDGLKAGKYYKYIINITSTGNGTNDPDEANTDSEEISVKNSINVIVNVTDYGNGDDTKIITI